MRVLAIGDIHGALTALETLLEQVKPRPGDRLITLGDYVDRGPDSRGVLERLIALHATGVLVPLRGNHEIMMLSARTDRRWRMFWLRVGGLEALQSYAADGGGPDIRLVPEVHWHFIENVCRDWYETENHFFVHAGVDPDLPLAEQDSEHLHWETLNWARPHVSGKVMVCGHTEQRGGEPLNLGFAVDIDTWAYHEHGWLTCLEVETGFYWQADQNGASRTGWLGEPG